MASFDFDELWPYELRRGNSSDPREGACVMDAVSWFAYGRLGDHPACASPVLTAFVIRGQDAMPDDVRQQLKPYIFRLIGSRDPGAEAARVRCLVLAAARVFAPMAFDAVGLAEIAAKLRALPDDTTYTQIAEETLAARVANAFAKLVEAEAAKAKWVTWAAATADATEAAAATWAAEAAAAAAAANEVWLAYIAVLDEALSLGKQGDMDLELVGTRLREFEEARHG